VTILSLRVWKSRRRALLTRADAEQAASRLTVGADDGEGVGTGRTFVLCSTDSFTMGLICSSRSVSMVAGIRVCFLKSMASGRRESCPRVICCDLMRDVDINVDALHLRSYFRAANEATSLLPGKNRNTEHCPVVA
jgi:hypothetical protein